MLAVTGISFKSNHTTNKPAQNQSYINKGCLNSDTLTLQKSRQIGFKGIEELSPNLAVFWKRFAHILNDLNGARIAEDTDRPENFLIMHDKDKLLSTVGKYYREQLTEQNKIINRAKPENIEGLIMELSQLQEKFSYNLGFPHPFASISPNDGPITVRIAEKSSANETLNMAYNPELYEFLKSGKLAETKFAIDHNGKFFSLSINPDIIEYEGQKYNYIDLIAEPVKE